MVEGQKSYTQEVIATATKDLEKLSSRYDGKLGKKEKVDKDRNSVEMIYTVLQSIPDGMSKAMLWL